MCREAQESASGRSHALQHDLHQERAAGEERTRELAQLQEVSLQADAGLQQCLSQLQVLPQAALLSAWRSALYPAESEWKGLSSSVGHPALSRLAA